jgi:hypothetical protein
MPPISERRLEKPPPASAGSDVPSAATPPPSTVPPASPAPPAATAPAETDPAATDFPTPAAIEAARGKIVEIFGGEARQAVKPEQKLALAQRMVQVASETNSDRAVKYVLLDEARKLQAAAGDVDQALATVAGLADEFDGDLGELQLSTLAAMSDVPLPSDQRDQLASVLLALVNRSVAEEEFASAEEFAKLAVKVSTRSADVNLRRSIVQKRSELTRLGDEFRAVRQARESSSPMPPIRPPIWWWASFSASSWRTSSRSAALGAEREGALCGCGPR